MSNRRLPRMSQSWTFWPFSVITYFQLSCKFVPAPTIEETGSQIIPLQEFGDQQVVAVLLKAANGLVTDNCSPTDLRQSQAVLSSHYTDKWKRSQEVGWFLLVQILWKWQKQQLYLMSSSPSKLSAPAGITPSFQLFHPILPSFPLFFKKSSIST